MGNLSSHHAGKVILPDGSIHEFQEPTTAAELMLEHPQQVVVEFNYKLSSSSSKPERLIRPTPLPSFSSQDAHQILLRVNAVLRAQSLLPSSSSTTLRFFAKIRPLNGGDGHKFVVPRKDEDDGCSVGRKDNLTLQASGKGWKPSLDTIKENKEGRKELNLVLVASKVGKRIETKGLVWG